MLPNPKYKLRMLVESPVQFPFAVINPVQRSLIDLCTPHAPYPLCQSTQLMCVGWKHASVRHIGHREGRNGNSDVAGQPDQVQ